MQGPMSFEQTMDLLMAQLNANIKRNRNRMPQERRVSRDPSDLGELFDRNPAEDYGDEDNLFRCSCVASLKRFLIKHKRMTAASAKIFIASRVTIDVQNVSYEDEDEIRTLAVISRVQAAEDPSKFVELHYEYHHRCRSSWLEHLATLKCAMPGTDTLQVVFESYLEDMPLENAREVEKRTFCLSEESAKAIKDEVFGEGWSTLEALLVCYAAAGVGYGYGSIDLPSAASCPSLKAGWVEHYTRKVCAAVSQRDDGYETEPFSERYEAEMRSAQALAKEFLGTDDEYDDEFEDDDAFSL